MGSARNTPFTPNPAMGKSNVNGTTIKALRNREQKIACFASPTPEMQSGQQTPTPYKTEEINLKGSDSSIHQTPQEKDIAFEEEQGYIKFVVDKFECHQLAVWKYRREKAVMLYGASEYACWRQRFGMEINMKIVYDKNMAVDNPVIDENIVCMMSVRASLMYMALMEETEISFLRDSPKILQRL